MSAHRNQDRQNKIEKLFQMELENNPNKMQTFTLADSSKDSIKIHQFWFPRIMIQKHISNSTTVFSMYETNSPIYFPLEEKYIDLCLEHGTMTFSRTLRIFKKKKALKKITKQKTKPEGWEDKVESLVNSIDKIYNNGNTINLNKLR
ncbi:MAG: hypothetical protein L7V85_08400 [Bacteroidia bacterium]|nr:hypothetical protein [Bacteroidia bacterium]